MFDSLRPHGPQHNRPPCPSPTPRVHPNPCPLSRWCHPTVSSSVIPFSCRLQSFPASGSFPVSWLFSSGGQSIGVTASASDLPVNTQDWSPLGWTGCISLQSNYCYLILNKFVIIFYHTIFRARFTSFLTPDVHYWFLFNSCYLLTFSHIDFPFGIEVVRVLNVNIIFFSWVKLFPDSFLKL